MTRRQWTGLLWMARRFGVRRTFRYWREGQRRGWMTEEQARAFFREVVKTGEL